MRNQHLQRFARLCAFICLFKALPTLAAEVTPGFDCGKATTAVEKLICQDRDLKWADHTLANTYQFRLKALSPESAQVFVRDQKEWLALRARACVDAGDTRERTYCLLDFYQKRNRVLLGKYWLGWNPSPDELAAKLKEATFLSNQQGFCPVSRDFDLEYYLHMAGDEQNWDNPIFFEVPRGLKVEEVKDDYKPIDAMPERLVPSLNAPRYNQINPHHGWGDTRMKIYCRVQDANGVWWLAHKGNGGGVFTYFLSSEMELVPFKK